MHFRYIFFLLAICCSQLAFNQIDVQGNAYAPVLGDTYAREITDPRNNLLTSSFTVPWANPLTVEGTTVNPSCAGGGSITLTVTGGTAPYTYIWSNGAITASLSDLSAGVYSVQVKDATGYTAGTKFQLAQPQLQIIATKSDADCTASNVSVNLEVRGGQPPYSYLWSTGAVSQNVTGLTPGSYSVVVKDAAGCSITHPITIHEPAEYTVSFSVQPVTSCDPSLPYGKITVHIEGGNAPFLYFWEQGYTNVNRSLGLPAGSHILRIGDANGCVSEPYSVVVPFEPEIPVITLQSNSNEACDTNFTGSISAAIYAFGNSYTYSLFKDGELIVADPSGTTNSTLFFAELKGGRYELEVISAPYQCSTRSEIVVEEVQQEVVISAVAVTEHTDCSSGNGAAFVTGVNQAGESSDLSHYSYQWTDSDGRILAVNAPAITNLTAGTYFVTATKHNGNPGSGCTSEPVVVTVPFAPVYPSIINLNSTPNQACNTNFNGEISATISFQGSYDYILLNEANEEVSSRVGISSSNLDFTSLAPGMYTLSVNQLNGCPTTETIAVPTQDPSHTFAYEKGNVQCAGESTGWIQVETQDDFEYVWYKEHVELQTESPELLSALSPGTYQLKAINTATGCAYIEEISIDDAPPLKVSETIYQLSAYGANDASILLDVSGGTPPYTFLWNNGETSANLIDLSPEIYSVIITDAHNCIQEKTFSIIPLSLSDVRHAAGLIPSRTAANQLRLELKGMPHARELKVYRLDGRLAASADVTNQNELFIDLPHNSPSLYLLVVSEVGGSQHRLKILF